MAKALSKDEKDYINNEVTRRLEEYKEDRASLEREYLQIVYDNLPKDVFGIIRELEEYSGVKFVDCKKVCTFIIIDKYPLYFYSNKDESGSKKYISFECKVKFNKDIVEKLNNLSDRMNKIIRRTEINNEILTRYYVLFTTWEVKSKDRLNKINELIDLIYKEITK